MNTSAPRRASGAITIGLCLIVALLEGLDLQSTGVAAPRMAREFHLAVAQMGWAFSIGALGLLPGAAIGGRLAGPDGPQARADAVGVRSSASSRSPRRRSGASKACSPLAS